MGLWQGGIKGSFPSEKLSKHVICLNCFVEAGMWVGLNEDMLQNYCMFFLELMNRKSFRQSCSCDARNNVERKFLQKFDPQNVRCLEFDLL